MRRGELTMHARDFIMGTKSKKTVMDVLIRNIRVMDPAGGLDRISDILIEDGRIVSVSPAGTAPQEADCLDGTGLIAAPGLVDVHVHFRDPGQTHKEDLQTGARAALRGGVTTVLCMANTVPPVDSPEALRELLSRTAQLPIQVYQAAAVTKGLKSKELTPFAELRRAGAACFTDDGIPLTDSALTLAAMQEAQKLDAVISLHEEDPALMKNAGVHAGKAAKALGLSGAPAAAEDALVARDCMLALHTGARVHIQHISSANSVEIVRMAKALGAHVTAEATPHHFSLCEDDVLLYGTNAKMNPPLRTAADREAVCAGLADGTIDLIATDHAPHAADEKARPFTQAPSGIIGLETSLSLGITSLVRQGRLTLMQLIEKMSAAPARVFGLDAGSIAPGKRADLVIFAPDETWKVEKFVSRSSNSPFLGQTLFGKIHYTVAGGVVYETDGIC